MKRLAFLFVFGAAFLGAKPLAASDVAIAGLYHGPHIAFRLTATGKLVHLHIFRPHGNFFEPHVGHLSNGRTWDYAYQKIAEHGSSTFLIHGTWTTPLTVHGYYRTKSGDNRAFAEWHAQWVFF